MKTYKTRHNMSKVCFYLITRGRAFNYIPKKGLFFQADDAFVKEMRNILVVAYGCSLPPVVEEVK